jgi:DNA-binding transcriptional MerR regulator
MSRGQRLRPARKAKTTSPEPVIPDKVYFRIGEVSRLAQTKPYVLRYWETEFPTLRPAKTRSGHRVYRRKDVETVFAIRRLLYEQGFTIEGARKQLTAGSRPELVPEQKPLFPSSPNLPGLQDIQRELQSILTMLSRKPTVMKDK